MIMPN